MIRIQASRVEETDQATRLVFFFRVDEGEPSELWFEVPSAFGGMVARDSYDAAVAALLPPAMKQGHDIEAPGAVSPLVLTNLPRLMRRLLRNIPGLTPVHVHGRPFVPVKNPCVRASFFSGGVDSFFTMIRNPQITHLILVWGFDIRLSDQASWSRARDSVSEAARSAGKQLITVKTNLRDISEPVVGWGAVFGPALAAVALLLGNGLSQVLIPAAYNAEQEPGRTSSQDDIDPLWSNESTAIAHHGSDFNRLQKVQLISQDPVALRFLRVCYTNSGDYNCCHCEKCVRTMLELDLFGALDRCPVFKDPLRPGMIARTQIPHFLRAFWTDMEEYLRDKPGKRRYTWAIRYALASNRVTSVARSRVIPLRRWIRSLGPAGRSPHAFSQHNRG